MYYSGLLIQKFLYYTRQTKYTKNPFKKLLARLTFLVTACIFKIKFMVTLNCKNLGPKYPADILKYKPAEC